MIACPCVSDRATSSYCLRAGAACIAPTSSCPVPATTCTLPKNCNRAACATATDTSCAECSTGFNLNGGVCVEDIAVYCNACVEADVSSALSKSSCPDGTHCCVGCGTQRGVCSKVCPAVLCAQTVTACPTPDPTTTTADVTLTHTLSITCDDPRVDNIVTTIGTVAQNAIGTDYPGTVVVVKKSCDNTGSTAAGKRQQAPAGSLTTVLSVNGPGATTAAGAATNSLSSTPLSVSGATATYSSAAPSDSSSSGLSGGDIAGIVIGSVAAVVIVAILAVVVMNSRADHERY